MSRGEVRPDGRGLMRALLLSAAAASVPVAGTFLFPDHLQDYEALTWLLLLVPGFLWAYERGWRGVATALAAGMAVLSITYAAAEVGGRTVPDLLLPVIVIYVGVSLGIGLFGDRVGKAKFDAAAESLALQDPLTGLPNRRHAELHVDMQFAAAERGQALSVVVFDVDHFSAYNERNGRGAGDGVLRSIATILRQQTRRMDLAARYGPEEFISVLAGCPEEGALIFAARLQERLRAAEHTVTLPTVSAGIAAYRPDVTSPRELMQAAEQALRLAKRDGRDRVRIHGRDLVSMRTPDPSISELSTVEASAASAVATLDAVRAGLNAGMDTRLGVGRSAFVLTASSAVRAELGGFLRAHGFVVAEGEALVDTMTPLHQDFDLVFVDVARRGSPAADMVRQIRMRNPATRILGLPRADVAGPEPAAHADPSERGAQGTQRAQGEQDTRRRQGTAGDGAAAAAAAKPANADGAPGASAASGVRLDGHYTGLGDPVALRQQLAELLAEGDALRNAQVRQQALSNEMRAMDRQARLALAASEAKYRQVVQSIQEVIFSTDPAGQWTLLNPAWSAITGFGVDETIGQPLFDFLHPEDAPAVRAQFEEMVSRRRPYFRHEGRWRTRSGAHRWIELRIQLDVAPSGNVDGTTGVLADVTERRRAEDALRESEQLLLRAQKMDAIGRLAGGVAHDFNNLLTAIQGHVDLLITDLPDGDRIRPDLLEIRDAADRATSLTRQLLAFSRRQVLQPRVLELNEVIRQMETMLRRVIGTGVTLTTELPAETGCVRADPTQIEQVLLNLVVNARDAMPRGGTVRISTARTGIGAEEAAEADLPTGTYAILRVEDGGTGMTQEVAAKAFEPFFTTKGPGGGTGLGLATVYGIVKQSGGHVWLRSRPGQGTEAVVALPTADAAIESATAVEPATASGIESDVTTGGPRRAPADPAGGSASGQTGSTAGDGGTAAHGGGSAPDPAASPSADDGDGARILLVEDEKAVRDLAARILRRQGYRVISAADGMEALEILAADRNIDLLLTDVVMPEISGQELANRVRQEMPHLPVLFMSGYNEEAVLRDGVIAEGSSFLEKPFTPAALVERIRTILSAAGKA